jgi:hypothetical protein
MSRKLNTYIGGIPSNPVLKGWSTCTFLDRALWLRKDIQYVQHLWEALQAEVLPYSPAWTICKTTAPHPMEKEEEKSFSSFHLCYPFLLFPLSPGFSTSFCSPFLTLSYLYLWSGLWAFLCLVNLL